MSVTRLDGTLWDFDAPRGYGQNAQGSKEFQVFGPLKPSRMPPTRSAASSKADSRRRIVKIMALGCSTMAAEAYELHMRRAS
jgi:hypothetical protein